MPIYRITTYTIVDWTADFAAENEQIARDMAYQEVKADIPQGGYVEFAITELKE